VLKSEKEKEGGSTDLMYRGLCQLVFALLCDGIVGYSVCIEPFTFSNQGSTVQECDFCWSLPIRPMSPLRICSGLINLLQVYD